MSTDAEDIARAVLAKSSANDPTMPRPDELVVMAWTEHMEGLTVADALQAVTAHYDTESRRIMPADVRRRAITLANNRADRHRQEEFLREITARPAGPQRNHELAAWASEQFSIERGNPSTAKEREARDKTIAVRCPWCHAAPSSPCISPATGEPLTKSSFHDKRELAAKEIAR